MDSELEKKLEITVSKIREKSSISSADPHSMMRYASLADSPAWEELEAALRKDTRLNIFDGMHQALASGWSLTSIGGLGGWLVDRALQAGATRALADLNRYLEESDYPCFEIQALNAISVEGTTELAQGIALKPLAELPEYVREDAKWENTLPRAPEAFLFRKVRYPKIHFHWKPPGGGEPAGRFELLHSQAVDFENARLCLTLLGPSAPEAVLSWIQPTARIPRTWPASSMSIHSSPRLGHEPYNLSVEELSRARTIHSNFLSIKDSGYQDRLRLGLGRLNLALQRDQMLDRAIDLGIAAEVLFTTSHERGTTYKLGVRAARFLGTTSQERRKLFEIFTTLYKARSDAVHECRLSSTYRGQLAKKFLAEAAREVAGAIELAISRQHPVDWVQQVLE